MIIPSLNGVNDKGEIQKTFFALSGIVPKLNGINDKREIKKAFEATNKKLNKKARVPNLENGYSDLKRAFKDLQG